MLLATGLTLIAVLLAAHGITNSDLDDPADAPTAAAADPRAANAATVARSDDPTGPGRNAAPGTIALTFDDGPGDDTEAILDVLDRFGVPGTFFVVGARAVEHPDLVRRMARDGHQIGVHTFTHPHLASVPAWRQDLELDQTQHVLAAITGHTTNLLRLPFSDTANRMTTADVDALKRAPNYWAVFTDVDTRDWQQRDPAAIADSVTPPQGGGAIVMLHDGGGDRAPTVRALEIAIPRLQSLGYRFTTVTDAIGVDSPYHVAGTTDRLRGAVVIGALRTADVVATALSVIMIVVAALSVLRLALLAVFARRHQRRRTTGPVPTGARDPVQVSVIIPAYNEEVGIAAALRSVAASDHPRVDIVVVDDGSTDRTSTVVAGLNLPNVRLIRQDNAGKAHALNTGIDHAAGELLVLMDGDTVFQPDTLRTLIRPFEDPAVGAVSGNTKVGNRGGLIGRWQHIEYVMGFNLDRRMFDVLHCMPTVPGAIGAFRRRTLADVGGVSTDTLAEDTDLTMAVGRAGWRVVYEPDAIAWTEAPSTLGQLWRQRHRWCFGTLQAMWKHRHAVLETGAAGKIGRRGLPYLLLFQVILPLLAPIVDIAALYSLLVHDSPTIALTWVAFMALQGAAAWYAFRLDRESPRPLWALTTQQFVYRQLMYLVVIQSLTDAVAGIQLRWTTLRRTGRAAETLAGATTNPNPPTKQTAT